jgi:hypothetical protein
MRREDGRPSPTGQRLPEWLEALPPLAYGGEEFALLLPDCGA